MNLGEMALEIGELEVGLGEEGSNNAGPHIDKYRQGRGVSGPWCARFIYFLLLLASWASGRRRCIVRPTGSARVLAKRLRKAGRVVDLPMPGDIVLWERNGGMHINIVARISADLNQFTTLDGNKGRFPATVGFWQHKLSPLPSNLVAVIRLPEIER